MGPKFKGIFLLFGFEASYLWAFSQPRHDVIGRGRRPSAVGVGVVVVVVLAPRRTGFLHFRGQNMFVTHVVNGWWVDTERWKNLGLLLHHMSYHEYVSYRHLSGYKGGYRDHIFLLGGGRERERGFMTRFPNN